MTGYAAAAARGREEARERIAGRRKREAVRIMTEPAFSSWIFDYEHRLVGTCGHQLGRSVLTRGAEPPAVLVRQLGRRVTCEHDACRIPPKPGVPDAERCEYVMGVEVERRCPTRARYSTGMGRVCRKHRDHYVREGYLDAEGNAL